MPKPLRRKPSIEVREHILIEQRGACFWCLLPLDSTIWQGQRSIDYELEWDHAVPFAYLQASPAGNWVASCQICNAVKSDLRFRSVEEARRHIKDRRAELGYSVTRRAWWAPPEEETVLQCLEVLRWSGRRCSRSQVIDGFCLQHQKATQADPSIPRGGQR